MSVRSLKALAVLSGAGLCLSAGLFAPEVHAQVYVVDSPEANRCYRAAAADIRDDTAISSCDGAIRTDALPARDYAGTYVNRGLLKLRAGRTAEAMDDFQRGVDMGPLLGEAWIDRAAARLVQGDDAGAIRDASTGLTLGSAHREVGYWIRAYARERSNDWSGAYGDYRLSAQAAPRWDTPKLAMARFEVRPK